MSKILLYYKYVDIQYPEQIRKWQHALCQSLDLKGRIILAHEGINGTVGGSDESIQRYIEAMKAHPLFSDIDFKASEGGAENFPRLRVVVKKEIVRLDLDTTEYSPKNGGIYLTPEQAHTFLNEQPKDLVALDVRNWYESQVGTFKNAIIPNTKTFREFPAYVDQNVEQFKDKKVLMFCTGGVRCERASAYLKSKGITKEVYHIQGGIHRYVEQFPDGHFRGKNYVFDARITAKVNNDVLATCTYCSIACDDYINCINAPCNKQFIVCASCLPSSGSACSAECRTAVESKAVPIRTKPAKISHQEKR